jgi:hypothetical protein
MVLPFRLSTISPASSPALAAGSFASTICHHDTPVLRETQPGGQCRGDGLDRHSDFAAVHVPLGAELCVDVPHNIARNGETQPLIAARLRQDEVLMPMTCPLTSTSGPPLLPGLIGASV